MKKITVLLLAACLVLLGLVVGTGPAQAGEPKTVGICHATGSEKNRYTAMVVSKTAIIKKKGEAGGHGAHAGDIIPSFTYTEDGVAKTYPGQNLQLGIDVVGCLVPTAPLPPTYEPGTCLLPNGMATESAQPVGVVVGTPLALLNGSWSVVYTPAPGYTFGTTKGGFTTPVVPPTGVLPNGNVDPLWDAEAGECALSDTGAGTVTTFAVIGGVVLLLGLGAVFLSRKRSTEV